ncbi:MAG: DUF309 domain-containing protein [Verrucomicrobia bacterium]|nr:DUF309 domain-containing protein [Verrucomicrobiota bacterium]
MSKKSPRIAALIEDCRGRDLDPHYLGYFECFNRGLYYEAHDVLEELWLADRHGPNGPFYKGLIQFAGAFVHMQKHSDARPRLQPAAALLRLALTNFEAYPATHDSLALSQVRDMARHWLEQLETGAFAVNPLSALHAPRLELTSSVSRAPRKS